MESASSSESSFAWSEDYSITEDEAYVYCRVGAATKAADSQEAFWRAESPKPTVENWMKSSRDSGFAEKMLANEQTYTDFEEFSKEATEMEQDEEQCEDHEYYNLPFQMAKEGEHDYTYPIFNGGEAKTTVRVTRVNGKLTAKRIRAKIRRGDSQLSTISARTVVNGARPYRTLPRDPTPVVAPTFKNPVSKKKICCVECREEELKNFEACPETRVAYENLRCAQESDTIQLYGRLILTAMVELRAAPSGLERTAALQRKIEKILRLHTGIDLATAHEDFETAIKQFETLVERRLRAINDISPSCYQKIADKLCSTQSAARRQKTLLVRLASIRRGIQRVLGI
ncbi:hypothetical protein Y032_0138g2049 [Ancylostoma ceylanicum]|nr:hypothetical protein Y032_0138g2049 [Ancylostoma ceylanicum]